MTSGTILLGVTSAQSVPTLLKGQVEDLTSRGWTVHIVCSATSDKMALQEAQAAGATIHTIRMEREISPFADARAMVHWIRLLREIRPSVVNVGTPKAALLGSLAAKICKIPIRIYTLRGLRYETTTGVKRQALIVAERATIRASTITLAVSNSLREAAIHGDRLTSKPIAVIGAGSSNGVSPHYGAHKSRSDLQIDEHSFVVGFVGRPSPDKGLNVLLEAARLVSPAIPRLHLLVIGHDFRLPVEDSLSYTSVPWVESARPYYKAMDVLCLPTFREGFPNVVLEAGMSATPSITTTATGARDSVLHQVTGLLTTPGDSSQLAQALKQLHADADLVHSMGRAAYSRASEEFQQKRIWNGLHSLYIGQPNSDVHFGSRQKTSRSLSGGNH